MLILILIRIPLTNKEALTVLCSGSGRAWNKCRGKHKMQLSVFPYFLSAWPLPKLLYNKTEHSRGFFICFMIKNLHNFPLLLLNFQAKLYFPKE